MPQKLYPTDLLDQAQAVLDAWNQFDPAATFGDLNCKTLSDEIAAARVRQSQMERARSAVDESPQRTRRLERGIVGQRQAGALGGQRRLRRQFDPV